MKVDLMHGWIERNAEKNWLYENGCLSVNNTSQNIEYTWKHIFETDVHICADITMTGDAGIFARYTGLDAYVAAGYDNNKRVCFIEERVEKHLEPVRYESREVSITEKTMLDLTLSGSKAVLSMNNERMIDVSSLKQITAGKVGLFTGKGELKCRSFELDQISSQGRIADFVLNDYFLPRDAFTEGASLFELDADTQLINVYNELFISHDKGSSFRAVDAEEFKKYEFFAQADRTQYVRLHNGHILKIDNYSGGKSYLSTDNGMTSEQRGNLWDEALIEHNWRFYGGMNDKLREIKLPSGAYRVFYVADVRAYGNPEGQGGIIFHWEEVYYTDDEGLTWKKSKFDSRRYSALDHVCESMIIPCADGLLRMYCTWNDTDCIHVFISRDEGKTFGEEYALPQMKCPRSSISICEDPDKANRFYMCYVYAKQFDPLNPQPRTRLVLVRTDDGINWDFVADIWRWDDVPDVDIPFIHQIVDPSITVTGDYVYVLSGISECRDDGYHNAQRQKIVKLDKAEITVYPEFPDEYGTDPGCVCGIQVSKLPKCEYHSGEELDLTGGEIKVKRFDGESYYIKMDDPRVSICEPDFEINYTNKFDLPDMSKRGVKQLRVSYSKLSTQFAISVL